jgi:putative glutamine amidotransferase
MGARVAVLIGRDPESRYSVHRGYVDALWEVGAVPLLVPPPPTASGLDRYLETVASCQAVCVTGGGDVDPSRYRQAPIEGLLDVDRSRDEAELLAVHAALAAGRPLLGICRGIQVIAVATGGRLHQDLPHAGFAGHWQEDRQYETVHAVEADQGSLTARVLGGAGEVNSIHHQGIADPGPKLVPTGWSPDGLSEALEGPGMLGLQWHPERLHRVDSRHLGPFRWLVSA